MHISVDVYADECSTMIELSLMQMVLSAPSTSARFPRSLIFLPGIRNSIFKKTFLFYKRICGVFPIKSRILPLDIKNFYDSDKKKFCTI